MTEEKDQDQSQPETPSQDSLQELREAKRRVFKKEGEERSKKGSLFRRLRTLVITLIIMLVAFGTGLAIFTFVVMPRWVHQGEEVRVPDVTNLSVQQAESLLDQQGLRFSIRGEQYDPNVPKGFIVVQEPRPNRVVRRGRTVSAMVSLGEEFASVPALFGESRRGAGILLSRMGLEVGQVVEAYSGEVARGLILATDPAAQAIVGRGTPIHLVVSLGSAESEYLMPDLRGREVKAVQQDLEALGFRVQVAGGVGSFASITHQNPPPGSRIQIGEQILLRVAGRVIP